MANVASSTNANLSDLKVEEMIKTNIISRSAKDDLHEESMEITKIIPDPITKTVNFTKIAPKPTTTTLKTANPGQVVIIQSPSGTPVPIRVAGTNSNNTNAGTTKQPVTIQVLRMADGSLLKINNKLNLGNLSNITHLNISGKKGINSASGPIERILVKNSNGSQTVLGTATKLSPVTNNGTPILKSLSVSEAQKAGFIKPKLTDTSTTRQLQKILPITVGNSVSLAGTTTTISTTQKKDLVSDSKEVVVEGNAKPLLLPQHILKLSPSSTGPIQAIQIPGKAGVQYVRVLGTAGTSTSTSKIVSSISAIKPKESSPTKITSSQIIGSHKIVTNAKAKHAISFVSGTKDGLSSQSIKPNVSHQKSLITTVPTLRKIQDPNTKFITIVKKNDEGASGTKFKPISQQQLVQKKPNQDIFRQIQSNESNMSTSSNTSEITSPKKLFSVLKPVADSDENSYIPRKRSPSPDALRRKHCNCTKSQCLKLYCDCFANGEFCQDCNCKECFNNLEYEDERQKAIKICLERNPNAFK